MLKIFNSSSNAGVKLSVSKFAHNFMQNTIIGRIESADDFTGEKELIIISAHQVRCTHSLIMAPIHIF